MQFPLSWLKEYLKTELSPLQIADELTKLGLEVEEITPYPIFFERVIVGEVRAAKPHPSAEKLTIAEVFDGHSTHQVVCAAANCRAGIKTAFAPVGSTVGTLKITARALRGIDSHGMLCGHDELGLSDHGIPDGIMELPKTMETGTDLAPCAEDHLFHVALTPNLIFAASVMGVARELAAALGTEISVPTFQLKECARPLSIKVDVEKPLLCPRYSCCMIDKVKVGPSPEWLTKRLEKCSVRSVNNIVDVTNYILLKRGQPLHAFDHAQLAGGELNIRTAAPGERLTTLDGKERSLDEKMLVIADRDKPVAIAGVMGGADSEVSDGTTTVVLEAAYFEPTQVRRTSKHLSLSTDASYHFERGTDPEGVITALNEAAHLIQEVAGGEILQGCIDTIEAPIEWRSISCRLTRVNQLLGTKLSLTEVETIFHRLSFTTEILDDDTFSVGVPPMRHDVKEEIDLVEEVARLFGYDNLKKESKPKFRLGEIAPAAAYLFEKKVRAELLRLGLQELLTSDLIGKKEAELMDCMPSRSLIHLLNPRSDGQSILRPSLMPGLLKVVQLNEAKSTFNLQGFEMGRLHFKVKEEYVEPTVASIILAGHYLPPHWQEKGQPFDFYDLKGCLEQLLHHLKFEQLTFSTSDHSNLHPGQQAAVHVDEHEVGIFGQVHPSTLKAMDIKHPVFFAEINLTELQKLATPEKKMQPLPQFPASSRDVTLTLPKSISMQEVFGMIEKIEAPLLESFSLIDVYHDEKLGSEANNVTLRFVYREKGQTISMESVEREHQNIVHLVSEQLA